MLIHEKLIDFYIDKLQKHEYFCLPGYSDAEFYSMMQIRLNTNTGLGQMISREHGLKLLDVMKRRQLDNKWMFAIPKCLWGLPVFARRNIDSYLSKNDIHIQAFERDMILDDLAKNAGLYPFIKQLQKMETVFIGPKELNKTTLAFLGLNEVHHIESPNFHTSENFDTRIADLIDYHQSDDRVFLISAGVSAPIIIDRLYAKAPSNFYIDCGSIWDAFANIGGQRQWRADLYANPNKLIEWKRKNIYGE